MRDVIDSHLDAWNEKISLAEQMIPVLGHLYRQRGLVLRMFGRKMVPATTIDIVKAHRFFK